MLQAIQHHDVPARRTGTDRGRPIWREPARGGYPDPRLFQLSGIDQLRSSMAGRWPRPPMSYLTGLVFTDVDDAGTVCEMPASEWFLSSQGVIPGGFLTILADVAFGTAILARLPARTPFMTSEISLNFIRPATAGTRVLRARGRALHVDDGAALAACMVEGAGGEILVHGTTRCVTLDQLPPVDVGDAGGAEVSLEQFIVAVPAAPALEYKTPSPYLRPVAGTVLPRKTWEGAGGREVLERQIEGVLPMPPIHHLTGIRPIVAGDGEATFAMPCTPWLTSGFGTVQGGFTALLAYSALASSIQATTEPDTSHLPVDLKINYLRPIYPDSAGRDLVARGKVVHRGRTLRVADSEVLNPDGVVVAVARGTSILLPGRPAWDA